MVNAATPSSIVSAEKIYGLLTSAAQSAGSTAATAVFDMFMKALGAEFGVEAALGKINSALTSISNQIAALSGLITDNEHKRKLDYFDNIALSVYGATKTLSREFHILHTSADMTSPAYREKASAFCRKVQSLRINGNTFENEVFKLGNCIMRGSSGIGEGALVAFDNLAPGVSNWDILAHDLKRDFRIYAQTLYTEANAMALFTLSHDAPDNPFIEDLERQIADISAFFVRNRVTRRNDGKAYNLVVGKEFYLYDFFQCKKGDFRRVYCNQAFKRYCADTNGHQDSDVQVYDEASLPIRFAANGIGHNNTLRKTFVYISEKQMHEMVRRANNLGRTLAQEFNALGITIPASTTNWLVFGDDSWPWKHPDDSYRVAHFDMCMNVVDITTNVISQQAILSHRAVYYMFKEWCVSGDAYVDDVFVFLLPDEDYWCGCNDHDRSCIWGFTSPAGDLYARKRTPINGEGAKQHNILPR